VIRVRMADDDAQQARVKTVRQPGDIRKRDILARSSRYRPAHIQHETRSAGFQLDAVAPDLGSSAMDSGAHTAGQSIALLRLFSVDSSLGID
jgi:hypothetical protein